MEAIVSSLSTVSCKENPFDSPVVKGILKEEESIEGITGNEIMLHLENILSQLDCSESSAPQIIGLWGMPGIGKTYIAKEIFRTQAERYDVCYFLPDFHLMCQARGLSHLRDEFFSKIFEEDKVFIDACDMKLSFLRDRLLDKRVLIVLDGVSNATDVEVLVGGFGWLSGRHTIILTSRNRQVLVQCNAKEIYKLPKLSKTKSFQLCSHCATNQNLKLISMLSNYACGIPLALQVLGLSIQMQCINDEKQHLSRLRRHPPIEIQDSFRKSFNRQDDDEKNIFLDLACFFRGENKDHVVNILDGCGLFTDIGIHGLIDESLISLKDNRIEMPTIFQDMGRFIVRQEYEEAGKRSRLWDSNDIVDVLINNSGTEAIKGIVLDVSDLTFDLSPTVFERMYRLRLLKFHCPSSETHSKVCLPQGLYSLPDQLRLLHWERFPLRSLPQNFNPKHLVELNMPYSNMKKLWKGTKNLEKLKRIILSHSQELTGFPRLRKARNLEHIDLEGCTSLVKVNSSIIHHHKLTFLSLKDCSRLRVMPTTVHLGSLEVLDLSGCSELEELQNLSPNLKELYLAGTAIREMPSSLRDLTRLVTLDLKNCKRLQHWALGISNLKAITTHKLSDCSNLKIHPTLHALSVRGSQCLNKKISKQESVPLELHSAIKEPRGAIEEFLRAFDSPSSKGITQANWSSIRFNFLPSSIFHSLASRLTFLMSLSLCNAGLMHIPEELFWLPFVKKLDLDRNSFSQIPENLKELRKLHSLRLRHCKNLTSLPDLPRRLETVNAHGCVSLKSFPASFDKFPRHYTFSNCFALSPEVVRKYMRKALNSVEVMSKGHQQEHNNAPAFSICIPASPCHKSSVNFQAGSSVKIKVTHGILKKTHLCFALSVVVEFGDNYRNAAGFGIKCICWKTRTDLSPTLERIFQFWAPKEAPTIQKDHMFLFGSIVMDPVQGHENDVMADLLTFEFHPVNAENQPLENSCTVKRSRVYLITETTYDTVLGTKRPTSFMDSVEQMAPPYKRCRLKSAIDAVILSLRKRKREKSDFRVNNHSKVQLDKSYRNLEQNEEKKLGPNKFVTNETARSQSCSSLADLPTSFNKSTRSAARTDKAFRDRSLEKKRINEFGDIEFGVSVLYRRSHSDGSKLDAAAIRIQAGFRGYKSRKQHLVTRQGIVLIQARWRGYQVRKNYRKLALTMGLVD